MTERARVQTAAPFDAFAELLAALPVAAAALDGSLRVLWANAAFERLAGKVDGGGLEQHFRIDESLMPGLAEQRLRARTHGQLPVELHLCRTPYGYVLSARPAARDEADEAVQRVLLQLSREVVAARTEDEIVGALAKAVRALFPGGSYAVRVVDPRTYALTSLYAEGKLLGSARGPIALAHSAAEKLGLDPGSLPGSRVQLVNEVPLLFQKSARGFSTPLVSSGQLFGMLNVEFPQGDERDGRAEERSMLRAANHAAAALRNAKLFDEVSYVRRYLESLIEHANALIVVTNAEGRVLVANAAVHRLLALPPSNLLGVPFLGLFDDDEVSRVQRLLDEAIAGGAPASFEAKLRPQTGKPVRAGFSTAAVRSAGGEVEGVIAVGQDLTRLRALEEQVIQAEKLASLGQLAAGVAHEINNPLTTISIYADALLQKHDAIPDPARKPKVADAGDVEKLRRILEASDRILKLARDLTSYARPSGDHPEPTDINALVDQAIAFCDHVVKESEVQLARGFASPLPKIPAVKSNLVQVFINLITNACHATPAGGRIELTTAQQDARTVVVRVRDTGSGISPENLAQIFEPFFTTKPAGEGTGLGLSIVQGIVTKHGGQIRVTSEVGQGTEFVVELPVLV